MNLSNIPFSIGDIKVSLERERTIPPKYPKNEEEVKYAKLIPVKKNHNLNKIYEKYLPECTRKIYSKYKDTGNSLSAEDAVFEVLMKEFYGLQRLVIEYDGIEFYPDGVAFDKSNPEKPGYLIEIKTKKHSKSLRPGCEKYIHDIECVAKFGGLQALRNSSALIMSGLSEEIIPKVVLGEFIILPLPSKNGKIPIMLKRISIYRVRINDTYLMDKELAARIYALLGKGSSRWLTLSVKYS